MKKSIMFSLIITSFLFGQETQVNTQLQTTSTEQSVFDTKVVVNAQENIQAPTTNLISSFDAYERMKLNREFFILDIRAPQKVAIIGGINNTNLHIAFENFNTKKYDFEKNKYFYDELKYGITSKNIPHDKDIYIFDNYGYSVSEDVGKYLNELGYINVYAIEDGFEGSKARYGKFKNQRVVNGWKNKTDEWNLEINSKNYWNECKYSFLFQIEDRKTCEPNFVQGTQEIQDNLGQQIKTATKKISPNQLFQ